MDNFNAGSAEAVKNLASAILELTTAGFIDGISRFLLLGHKSMSDFGKELPEFGKSLKEFGDNVSGLDANGVAQAAAAAKSLAEMVNALPSTGSAVKKWWSGEKDLNMFASELPTFGASMALFSERTKNIDAKSMDGIVTVAVNYLVQVVL